MSPVTVLTRSWQSSNTPSIARLKMFASVSEYICAVWNGLMRPLGESMNTLTPRLPRSAYSAADPVSPEVAPRMFNVTPSFATAYSNSRPSSCRAMSLNARVGPPATRNRCRLRSSVRTGVISSLPKVAAVYVRSMIASRSSAGMSSA